MNRPLLVFGLLCLLSSSSQAVDQGLAVQSVTPADGAKDVGTDTSVQIHTTEPFDPKTIGEASIRLIGPDDRRVEAVLTGDLGGVITVSPDRPLAPESRYRVVVTPGLKGKDGTAARPFESHFTTGKNADMAASAALRFEATRLDEQRGVTTIAVGPDGHVYSGTWTGTIRRHRLDPKTGRPTATEVIYENDRGRILGLAFDPDSTEREPVLWVTYDLNSAMSTTEADFSGTLAKLEIPTGGQETLATETLYIVGFASGAHALNGITFGPDGRLYISQGSLTHLGGETGSWKETPLTGAMLVADVRDPDFHGGQLPLTIRPHEAYDATRSDAPLKVYATGIREAYGPCWHSNGNLYAGVNMNDTNDKTPEREGLPSFSVRPDEPLIRILEGKYYGHPNPSIDRYILMGGNPTDGTDPWEIDQYPVGTLPEPDFDPSLLVFNLVAVGGQSADGSAEYTHPGPLQGRLLICFYTSARTIHTFQFSDDGAEVVDHGSLVGTTGEPLKFGAPLDLTVHPSGRIYVADFSDPRRGDSGATGGVWVLDPVVETR